MDDRTFFSRKGPAIAGPFAYPAAHGEHEDLEFLRVVLERLRGSGKESGVPIESASANLVTVRDGRIVRVQLFSDRDEACSAAALPPREAP